MGNSVITLRKRESKFRESKLRSVKARNISKTKKYELTDETIEVKNKTFHRIRALRDFGDVKTGDLGGYIEKESNLSHYGDCWIYDNAVAYNDAHVYDNAQIRNNAHIFGSSYVYDNAKICDNAKVGGNAIVFENAIVCDKGYVYDKASIRNNAIIGDIARISGYAKIFGDARILGIVDIRDNVEISYNAFIRQESDYLYIKGFGPDYIGATAYRNQSDEVFINYESFNGPLDEFKECVKANYRIKHAKECLALADAIQAHFDLKYNTKIGD